MVLLLPIQAMVSSPVYLKSYGVSSNYSSVINGISVTDACAAHNAGVGHNYIIITYLHILINVGKRVNSYVFPDFEQTGLSHKLTD